MAVREPEPHPVEIKTTWWSVWPTWESWTWPDYVGKTVNVEVYSKYPMVRLYLNDKRIGEKSTTDQNEHKAEFTVSYAPGQLKAVGLVNGMEMESTVLQTSGDVANVRLSADRKEIVANAQDLSYVTIELTDKNGVLQPNAVNRLLLKIEGPGVIAGVANADVKDTDSYVGNTHKAWHGRALVVVRSTHGIGDIKLMVSSIGLSGAVLNIKAISEENK